MLRTILLSGFLLVGVVSLLLLALFIFQNKLLYFPTVTTANNYAPAGTQLWPPSVGAADDLQEQNILGLHVPPTANETYGTVIVFHGNAGHAGHRTRYAEALAPLGVRTVLAEYPGYGPRLGTPNEQNIVSDAVNTVELAHKLYGDPIWVIGESLGAGVAAAVTGQLPDTVSATVLITPWNRIADVAEFHYPYLPVQWLLRSEYDSIASLAYFDGPVTVVTAERDRVVPANLGQDLFNNISEPKTLIAISNAGHNDWPSYVADDFWPETVQWLCESVGCAQQ